MTRLALFFLGPPRIERDGVPLEVDTRKAIALLAYLAVTGKRHTRDALATLLWPEYDQTRARANLRRTLWALNKSLTGDWLQADQEIIGLEQDESFWLDVEEFHSRLAMCHTHGHPEADVCPACLAPLIEAVTLYQDDFMAGFTLRDTANFDDWQFFETESLRRELVAALQRLVRGHSTQGDFEPAIEYARRWRAVDPLHESAHRHLMQLYAWAGQRGAALRQYRECLRILEKELGVPPLEETTELYHAIKEQRSPAPLHPSTLAQKAPPHPSAPAPTLPLVGRSAEWATLLQAYNAIDAGGHLVVLEGEAGIGKTRLAQEFLTYIAPKGAVTISTRCYEGEGELAYGPFIEGLRGAIEESDRAGWLEDVPGHWLSEAARLLPELTTLHPNLPSAPPLEGPGAQSRFFEGVSQVLVAICGDSPPGVLLFDDLHWADEASLDLLTYLVRRLHGRPLCILVTWRSEQVPAGSRLHRLLGEAQRAGTATHLPLSRLSRSDVETLLQSTPARDLSQELSERLYRETEGLPFFVVEYLAALTEGRDAADAWSMPGGVRDLLRSRLAAVSETGHQLLHTAAVIGRSFDFDTVQEASGRSPDEAVTALEELMATGLVEEVSGSAGEGAQQPGAGLRRQWRN